MRVLKSYISLLFLLATITFCGDRSSVDFTSSRSVMKTMVYCYRSSDGKMCACCLIDSRVRDRCNTFSEPSFFALECKYAEEFYKVE